MLTRTQFELACKDLTAAELSDSPAADARRGWSWHEHPVRPLSYTHTQPFSQLSPSKSISGLGFLSRTVQHYRRHASSLDPFPVEADLEISLTDEDDATLTSVPESLVCRQYIVYSPTFQVPAFYFTVHDQKGIPLTLDDLMRTSLFHPFVFDQTDVSSFGLTRPASNLPLLSQGDHPTLGTPCWYLHPCESARCVAELMTEVDYAEGQQWNRWLEMWFVVLGTAVDTRW